MKMFFLLFLLFASVPSLHADEEPVPSSTESQPEEKAEPPVPLAKREEMSTSKYVLGGILGTVPGFGIGHYIQGRYEDRGRFFTKAEMISLGVVAVGSIAYNSFKESDYSTTERIIARTGQVLAIGGLFVYSAFHLWEIGDVWIGGASYNRKIREEKMKSQTRVQPFIIPTSDRGGIAGLSFQF